MQLETNEISFPPALRVFSSGGLEKEDLIFCLKFKVFINYIFILKCGKNKAILECEFYCKILCKFCRSAETIGAYETAALPCKAFCIFVPKYFV